MDLGLTGKRAIVTGASRGIGLAVARGLAAEGATVAMVPRGEDDLAAAARTVYGATITIAADTTDDASMRVMVERVVAELGGVDVLVNAAAPHMTSQGWGRIVNISGLNARRTGSISGSIRNVAVAALTANLADELGPHGVGVVVVHPGMVETERTTRVVADRIARTGRTEEQVRADLGAASSLGRMVTVAEVADVVVFLSSPRAAGVTGDAVGVGGGNRGAIHY